MTRWWFQIFSMFIPIWGNDHHLKKCNHQLFETQRPPPAYFPSILTNADIFQMGGRQQKNTRFHQICRCFIRFSARRFLVPVFTRPCGGLVRFFALDPRWRLGGSEPKGVIEWEIPGNLTASWDPFFASMIFEGRAVKPLGVFPFWGNQSWHIYGNLEGFPVK